MLKRCSHCGALDPEARYTLLEQNEKFFKEVRDQVSANLGQLLPQFDRAWNEYGGVEPWYHFHFGDAAVTIGWRKRVVSIKVLTTTPFNIQEIKAIVTGDKVTFEPFCGRVSVEESHHSEEDKAMLRKFGVVEVDREVHDEATKVVVHAWTQEKTVQYLTVLLKSVTS